MSRRGFRKTDAHRADPVTGDYALIFTLPAVIGFAVPPGRHGYGITVDEQGLVCASGRSPRHACRLAALFLVKHSGIGADLMIPARMIDGYKPREPERCESWRTHAETEAEVVATLVAHPVRIAMTATKISFRGAIQMEMPVEPVRAHGRVH